MIRIGDVIQLHESGARQMLPGVLSLFADVKQHEVAIVQMIREPVAGDENLRAYVAALRACLTGTSAEMTTAL